MPALQVAAFPTTSQPGWEAKARVSVPEQNLLCGGRGNATLQSQHPLQGSTHMLWQHWQHGQVLSALEGGRAEEPLKPTKAPSATFRQQCRNTQEALGICRAVICGFGRALHRLLLAARWTALPRCRWTHTHTHPSPPPSLLS